MRVGICVALWLVAASAHAADPYGLGDGHWGSLLVSAPDTVINEPDSLTVSAAQSDCRNSCCE